eukprot:1087876-Prymnesium_polylepis.2
MGKRARRADSDAQLLTRRGVRRGAARGVFLTATSSRMRSISAFDGMRGLPGLAERPFSPKASLPGTVSCHLSPVRINGSTSSTAGKVWPLRRAGQSDQSWEDRGPRELSSRAATSGRGRAARGASAPAEPSVVRLGRAEDVVEDGACRLDAALEPDRHQ